MKPNKLTLLSLAVAVHCVSPMLLAQTEGELDMTMTILEEGQEPAGLLRRIQLPPPESIISEKNAVTDTDTNVRDQVQSESMELIDEAAAVITDNLKDILSIEGVDALPDDIVDNLSDDLPLLNGIDDINGMNNINGLKEGIDAPVHDAIDGALPDAIKDSTDNLVKDIAK